MLKKNRWDICFDGDYMSIIIQLKNHKIELDNTIVDALDKLALILNEWNMTHNITGAKTIGRIEDNMIDALLPIDFMTFPQNILDVGTGAGFPGLVLAIALPKSHFTLCEPLQKRTAFLRFAMMEIGLTNVTIVGKKVEELKDIKYELITSRAVTNTKLLLDLTCNIRDENTQYLLYKGSRVFDEIADISSHKPTYDIIEKDFRNYLHIKSLNVI